MPLDADDLDPHVWGADVARSYDRSSAGMFAPEVVGPTVEFLRRIAADGPALEFAIGTGRIGLALAEAGVAVSGIEFSEAMAAELAAKPGGEAVPVVVGDMASTRVPGEFALVYLVYNTITNLLTQEQQVACFENAAAHLRPGGAFVIETFVPRLRQLVPGERYQPFEVTDTHLGFDEIDTVTQLLVSHHYDFANGAATTFSSPHRYVWPSELDLMAMHAGLRLDQRWADWTRAPFTAGSAGHVSVWRKVA